jgi:lysophospholipase L1-like esterase
MKGHEALEAMVQDDNFRDGIQILAIGSSSTEGVGASSATLTYPNQLKVALEALVPDAEVTVQNSGIGGETADTTVARLEQAVSQPSKPDIVIWQVGTNDAVRGGDEGQFRALLQRGITAAQRAGVDIVLLDQQFYPKIPDLQRYERYVGMVGEIAAAAEVGVFSRYHLMKEWDRSHPGLLNAMLSKDQFHMGDRGYRCLARALGREIASAVRPHLAGTVSMATGKRVVPTVGQVARRS